MGEMRKTRGTFVLEDQVIIAPNSPWMKSGTIKDNILFGTPGSAGGEAGEAASTNTNSEPAKGKLYDKAMQCSLNFKKRPSSSYLLSRRAQVINYSKRPLQRKKRSDFFAL